MRHVGYRVDTDPDGTPYARVHVKGVKGTRAYLADGAVPWHASARLRDIAQELTDLADQFDHDYPGPT